MSISDSIPENMPNWSSDDSADLYGIRNWGLGYFDISSDGNVVICCKHKGKTTRTPLNKIIQGMKQRGFEMPVMLRIENLLGQRIREINQAFFNAINKAGYQNEYKGVYPVKVNQQCHVVEEITEFGKHFHYGLEAGSKAELILAISQINDHDSLIVCNGYKDADYIDMGLYAVKMGISCFFVLETSTELKIILERSRKLEIEPLIGVRINATSNIKAKRTTDPDDVTIFGLDTRDLLEVIDLLKNEQRLHCLKMLHCHLGSQISNIRTIRRGVQEACQFYNGLIAEGAPLGYFDLGGGLAVDYEGTRTNHIHSMNYSLDEYCSNIIDTIKQTLDSMQIPHPVIVTESGRSVVAYSSLLLFNILEVRQQKSRKISDASGLSNHEPLKHLQRVLDKLDQKNIQESYNDAIFFRDEMRELFHHGQISLREKAISENFYLQIVEKILRLKPYSNQLSTEMDRLPDDLCDIYYGNFSLFQSLPDSWAINQVFPVLPIQRLDETPDRNAILADITCDSDGKIAHFIGNKGHPNRIKLHSLKPHEDYCLSVFLVGAYQETLGDLHNLFGDTHVISVHINADGNFDFNKEFHGDSIADVLSYVEYDPKALQEKFRKKAENAVKEGTITVASRQAMIKAYNAILNGYTYLER